MALAFISGVAGIALEARERAFLRDSRPFGLILFKRNIENAVQVSALVADFQSCVGSDRPAILIDQEGGRVQRLGPPHWPKYPPGAVYAALYERDPELGREAATLGARLIAADLADLGINVDCLPLADLPVAGADAIIGDRAYGTTPEQVADLARAAAAGLEQGGVLPVLKHIPGHGRATADSHLRLPAVDTDRATLERTDFAPFRALRDLPFGMTAHVVYSAIDPSRPATTSVTMISEVIRGHIGFDGALMGDDVSMGALSGTIAERARASLKAGCDLVLHCNGELSEMQAVAAEAPELSGDALRRTQAAMARLRPPEPLDRDAARARFAALLAEGVSV